MLSQLDRFYLEQPEPNRSFMLGLRDFILDYDNSITETWKWRLPFFCYKGKPFCYIWKDKKTTQVYLGMVKANRFNHPSLIQGNRKKMKIIYFDSSKDMPINILTEVFELAKMYYK